MLMFTKKTYNSFTLGNLYNYLTLYVPIFVWLYMAKMSNVD